MVVTWDSVNKGSGVSLSNNNLTVTIPNNANVARATEGKTSGKWYWEIKFEVLNNAILGVVRESTNLNAVPYNINGNAFYYSGGNKYPGATAYGSTYFVNDIISVLLDLDNGTIEFWKNGASQGIAFSDLKNDTTAVYPAITSGSGSSGSTATARFNIDEFTYQPPEGYLAYDGSKLVDNKILLLSNEKTYSFESTQESHILNMTSNTSPSPYVVTASHTRSSTYAPWKVFNGTNSSESDSWHTSTHVGDKWIQIDFGSARLVNEVQVTSINHSTATTRSPSSFSVLGSNDDVNFDTLFQTENDIASWNMNETMTFYFNNEKKYRFYRFLVKKTIENTSSFDLRLGQLLYSYKGKKVIEIPNSNVSNFIEYGADSPVKIDGTSFNKNYILTENDSENTEGLWSTKINRKPLSIKFN